MWEKKENFNTINARVVKWYTHYLEVVALARAWRFNSSPVHSTENSIHLAVFLFLPLTSSSSSDSFRFFFGMVRRNLRKEESDAIHRFPFCFHPHRLWRGGGSHRPRNQQPVFSSRAAGRGGSGQAC